MTNFQTHPPQICSSTSALCWDTPEGKQTASKQHRSVPHSGEVRTKNRAAWHKRGKYHQGPTLQIESFAEDDWDRAGLARTEIDYESHFIKISFITFQFIWKFLFIKLIFVLKISPRTAWRSRTRQFSAGGWTAALTCAAFFWQDYGGWRRSGEFALGILFNRTADRVLWPPESVQAEASSRWVGQFFVQTNRGSTHYLHDSVSEVRRLMRVKEH